MSKPELAGLLVKNLSTTLIPHNDNRITNEEVCKK